MEDKTLEAALRGLVRVGTVTDINTNTRRARVKYQDQDTTSGWLAVLDNHPHIPDYDSAVQRTEYAEGGSDEAAYASHYHQLTVKPWMPNINDTVLVLYRPDFNADGYVLGAIR